MKEQNSEDPTGVSGDSDSGRSLTRARDRKANAGVQLALAGASWDEIAEVLGYPTPRAARVAVELALEHRLNTQEDRDKMRQMTGWRLDRLLRAVWTKAMNDDSPEQLSAVREARSIITDHRKLYGLDAPTEVVVHSPTRDELESWVAKVTALGVPPVAEYDILEGEVLDTHDEAVGE